MTINWAPEFYSFFLKFLLPNVFGRANAFLRSSAVSFLHMPQGTPQVVSAHVQIPPEKQTVSIDSSTTFLGFRVFLWLSIRIGTEGIDDRRFRR